MTSTWPSGRVRRDRAFVTVRQHYCRIGGEECGHPVRKYENLKTPICKKCPVYQEAVKEGRWPITDEQKGQVKE